MYETFEEFLNATRYARKRPTLVAAWQAGRDSALARAEAAEAALAAERIALREFAKTALFRTMSDLSEACWCAGWMDGTEYFLWSAVEKNEPATWGMDDLRQRDIDELRRLRELADGWWVWDDEKFETFVSLDEMRQHLAGIRP